MRLPRPSPRQVGTLALLGGLLGPSAGCRPPRHAPAVLELTQFTQADEPVLLNEALVFHFSDDLDRASIHPASVRVLDRDGEPAQGSLHVERNVLRFVPALPCLPSLLDGGFRPGQRYTVELGGFPRLNGVRGRRGEPLRQTFRSQFETVAGAAGGGGDLRLFDNRTYTGRRKLTLRETSIRPSGPLTLVTDVPLDPRTVVPLDPEGEGVEDFRVRRIFRRAEGLSSEGGDPVQLRARLSLNRLGGDELLEEGAVRAEIELWPGQQGFQPGEYVLLMGPDYEILDLSGVQVDPVWLEFSPAAQEFAVVVPAEPDPEYVAVELGVEFADSELRTPEEVEGSDGVAWWSDSGAVRVRFPAAAGTGVDGTVVLEAQEARGDLHAVRLQLPAEATCELTGGPGLVVLRSQGRLAIDGRLVRRVESGERSRLPGEAVPAWLSRIRGQRLEWSVPPMEPSFEPGQTLSAWLAARAEDDPAWTVLVAGGDLVVTGEIDVDGPVLLAAGGRVRVPGLVAAREIWKVWEGGGNFQPYPGTAPLRFEEPLENPLREPLRFAVLSSPIRPPRGVLRWRPAAVSGRAGSGRFGVRYVGERDEEHGRVTLSGPVPDPTFLAGYDALRLQIELEVAAWSAEHPHWDPPLIDRVEVAWDEPGDGDS